MSLCYPLLAIEGSSTHLSIALFRAPESHVSFEWPADGLSHSQKILVLIDRFLSEQKIKLSDIKSFAAPSGPGSFTSLRIVLATLMGLADTLSLPIYTCSSLEALALVSGEGYQAPFLKAGRGQVYCAAYAVKGHNVAILIPESVLMPADFITGVQHLSESVSFCGPDPSLLENISVKLLSPLAWAVGVLVSQKQVLLDPHKLQINYLKAPDIG